MNYTINIILPATAKDSTPPAPPARHEIDVRTGNECFLASFMDESDESSNAVMISRFGTHKPRYVCGVIIPEEIRNLIGVSYQDLADELSRYLPRLARLRDKRLLTPIGEAGPIVPIPYAMLAKYVNLATRPSLTWLTERAEQTQEVA